MAAPDPWNSSWPTDAINFSWSSSLNYLTENVLTHPFVVIRRQCQINDKSRQSHRTPLTLMLPMIQLYSAQGFTPFWKGLTSTLAIKWMLMGTEDCISKPLAIITPFTAASLVETIESDLVPDDSNLLDFFKEGINRLLNWSLFNRRLLPAWVLITPTVAYGVAHYIISNVVQKSSIDFISSFRRQRAQNKFGAVPKEDINNKRSDSTDQLFSSLLGSVVADVLLYPLDTVLCRLHVQGSRAISDDMDTGYEVFPVITAYTGFWDCVRAISAEEGNTGFFKGFGALFLHYGLVYMMIQWSSFLIEEGQKFVSTQFHVKHQSYTRWRSRQIRVMIFRSLSVSSLGCLFLLSILLFGCTSVQAEEREDEIPTARVDADLGASREGSRTDTETLEREEEAMKLDGLSVKEMRELRGKAEKRVFQAEVNRMMKLIINSLYRNKEIFLRELISNASDALDKIQLSIKIKADKDNHVLTITDTGIGMTKADLINNLGTIAKSGTADFLSKLQDASSSQEMSDLIGQFGVGFYSTFLVADKVIVTTKHNDDKQYIWESDSESYSIVEDPRGDSLKRGTQISLLMKEEARDYLEQDTTETVEEPLDEDEEVAAKEEKKEEEVTEKNTEDEDAAVEEEKDEDKPKTKKNSEYDEFYKSITKDSNGPLAHTHFVAEGEVTFKSLLFVPVSQASESFNKYGSIHENIKLYVRRVFITDDFKDMMPNYLSFVKGVVDSDDLPLNVSRETLQQHKVTENYVERMKDKQEHIFYMAGGSKDEVKNSPFVERLLKKGYEVLYLTEAVDEYAISALPEFEGKKFQNVAKEGFNIDGETDAVKERRKGLKDKFEPLTKWLQEESLKDHILRAEVSERLEKSPCALITSRFGWTANMQRITTTLARKKALEINPRHPLIKELLRRIEDNPQDPVAQEMALMMLNTATLRSGYMLKDTVAFADHIENMMRDTLGVDKDEEVEEEIVIPDEAPAEEDDDDDEEEEEEDEDEEEEPSSDNKDEL
ncbi:HSP90B [Lepeophtheirus salmonis]|uniref:Heat shock protein 83 n=1 Tax=Lepeophtheirus salmonis TaxID=72036 RepID=A0A7R8CF47_LEPSM|nr:HSP90B [Lepeophtheirus salmonis]CAF2749048.1 HSP90B [Lepeophtheirus salmonis]